MTATWAPYYGTDTNKTNEIYVDLRRTDDAVRAPLGPYVPPETMMEFAGPTAESDSASTRPRRLSEALEARGVRETRLPDRPLPGRGHHLDRLRPRRSPIARLTRLAR